MNRFFKSTAAWVIVLAASAVACMAAGVAVCLMFGSVMAGISVYFFGTLLMLVCLGAFD